MVLDVLLADDQEEVRSDVRAALAPYGVRVVGEASTGRQLIAMTQRVACDAILMDLAMPDIDGLAALHHLSRSSGGPPVIVLSIHDDVAHVDRALELGASGYLLKSARAEAIVEALRIAIDDGVYLHPSVARAIVDRHLRLSGASVRATADISPRQRELVRALARGMGNKEIAGELGIREETVKGYLSDLYARIGVTGRAPAVAWAMRRKLVD